MKSSKYWLLATRPKTLPAGAMPVVIASALAFYDGSFNILVFVLTLICSLLIQILTNFINELYDYKKGADNKNRLGPQRQVASGNISYKSMKVASILLAFVTFLLGLILVVHGGWIILLIGLVSLFFAYAYTGGPYPLAYKGLGEIFVLIFFGLVAVGGTYYLHTLNYTIGALIAGFAPGLFSMNILCINNIRDIETDKKANKMTLAVKIGRKNAIGLYIINNILIVVATLLLSYQLSNYWILLSLLFIPIAIRHKKFLQGNSGVQLNNLLARTGKLLVIYGVIQTIGFIIGKYGT